MTRPRDKSSAMGLLPRMEARLGKRQITYRYHPVGGKPINLGHDKLAAIQQVLDMIGGSSDQGTVNELWRLYQLSAGWKDLAGDSRTDYTQSSAHLLRVFGALAPKAIKPAHIARYLRVERAGAPVRANREVALLSNLMNLGVERGELDLNPCKQVRRNKEKPRKNPPKPEALAAFLAWAWGRPGQAPVLAGMVEFASLAGNRGVEFRLLTWPQVGPDKLRLIRAKQRGGETEQIVEEVSMSPAMLDLMARLRLHARNDRSGWVFPKAKGGAHSAQSFKLAFNRLKKAARAAGVLTDNFTFHDLRAYFVTQYKQTHGQLPELHADAATTARVYDSSKVVKRKSL